MNLPNGSSLNLVASDEQLSGNADPDWLNELAADAEAEEKADEAKAETPVTNENLMTLAAELLQIEEQKAELEAQVKQVTDRRKQLRTQLIPDAMKALGMVNNKGKGVFTYGGFRIHLEQKVYASCSEAGRPLLLDFLRQNGDDELIKETVNAQTLSAYIRERRSEGLNDPPGVSVHEEVTAKTTKVR